MSNPLFIKAPFLTRKNFFNTNKTNNRATFTGSVEPMIPFFLCYYYKKKKNLLRSIWDKILFLFVYLPAAARSAASSIFFLGD